MMCIYSVFDMSHSRKTISFLRDSNAPLHPASSIESHVSRKTNPLLADWFDCWIYRGSAVWIKNIRHPWSVPLKGPWVSQWNQRWQCHIDPGHTPLFYWVGLNKIIASRLRARQGRVNCSDPQREARPHLPEKNTTKKAPVSAGCSQNHWERGSAKKFWMTGKLAFCAEFDRDADPALWGGPLSKRIGRKPK